VFAVAGDSKGKRPNHQIHAVQLYKDGSLTGTNDCLHVLHSSLEIKLLSVWHGKVIPNDVINIFKYISYQFSNILVKKLFCFIVKQNKQHWNVCKRFHCE